MVIYPHFYIHRLRSMVPGKVCKLMINEMTPAGGSARFPNSFRESSTESSELAWRLLPQVIQTSTPSCQTKAVEAHLELSDLLVTSGAGD